MKLFLLEVLKPETDQICSMHVIAENERKARIMADEYASSSKISWLDPANPSVWLSEKFTSCKEIDINNPSIIHVDI